MKVKGRVEGDLLPISVPVTFSFFTVFLTSSSASNKSSVSPDDLLFDLPININPLLFH